MKLSRMGLGVALLVPVPAQADPLQRYEALTQVAVHGCGRPNGEREIVVCGRRAADKWRVPFLGYDDGDPRGESVSTERNRLASQPPLRCGITLFTNNCQGKIGIGYSTNFASAGRLRPLGE